MQVQFILYDSFGDPLEGASVVLLDFKGMPTTIGDATDKDGNFQIYNTSITPDSKLRISHVDGITIIDTVKNINFKSIEMAPITLNEFVAIGKTKTKLNWWWIIIPIGIGTIIANSKADKK